MIKAARRRQRRRRIAIAVVTLTLGAAIAAGWALFGRPAHRSATSTGKHAARSVTIVYLKDETSPAKVEAMLTAMRGGQGVAGVTFVSKSAALAVEKRQVPGLVVQGSNPLPDSIFVRLTAAGSAKGIRADLKARGLLPGVAAIRPGP